MPQEIHITVKCADTEKFKRDCKAIGVKPIVIDLQTANLDVMTSQVIESNNLLTGGATTYTTVDALEAAGYQVIRKKIEVSPCHPLVPKGSDAIEKASGRYFEAHIAVQLLESDTVQETQLRQLCRQLRTHASTNYFKRGEQIKTLMLTYRKHTGNMERFTQDLDRILKHLQDFTIIKVIKEYCVYDSNQQHDKEWMNT